MNIVIFGAGAIGSFIGGLLSLKYDITLIGRKYHIDVVNINGLEITGKTELICRPKGITNIAELDTTPDLIILTVKSYDTLTAITQITSALNLNEDTGILSLQNGLDNLETIRNVLHTHGIQCRILGGTTCHGVTFIEPGHIYHAGVGETIIGEMATTTPTATTTTIIQDSLYVQKIREMFDSVGIETTITDDIKSELWAKAIVNASINPLTAITGLNNKYILELAELRDAMEKTCREAVKVANAIGCNFDPEKLIARTKNVITQTGENKSSMLQDLEKGKRTEIDSISGVIVKTGEKYSIPTPLNSTLYALVKGIEATMHAP
jgi:2-dehydropantoate 2-reductase